MDRRAVLAGGLKIIAAMVAPASQSPEPASSPALEVLKEWIVARTGLSYYQGRNQDLMQALNRVFAADGKALPPLEALLQRLKSRPAELEALVEQLTIGETFFFRHLEMFHALRDHVFPDIRERKAATRSLRIWSAGCSIGAEPYSISILLRELLGEQFKGWSIQILGTDINRKFLQVAETGVYDPWALRGMPPGMLPRHFTREAKGWRIKDHLRKGVTFKLHNLAADAIPDPLQDMARFDLIICRNVMIYFGHTFIQKLAGQFYDTLTPGGWLAVGHAEPHTGIFRMYRTVNATGAVLYQRPPGGTAPLSKLTHEPTPLPELPLFLRPVASAPTSRDVQALPVPATTPRLAPPTTASVPTAVPVPATPPQKDGGDILSPILQLADAGELYRALQACDEALLKHPLHAEAHYFHGMILYQFQEWAAADRSLKRSLYLSRDIPLAHYYLGLVQERLGRTPKKHLENAAACVASWPAEAEVPLGQGLTVREFRSLLAASDPASSHDS